MCCNSGGITKTYPLGLNKNEIISIEMEIFRDGRGDYYTVIGHLNSHTLEGKIVQKHIENDTVHSPVSMAALLGEDFNLDEDYQYLADSTYTKLTLATQILYPQLEWFDVKYFNSETNNCELKFLYTDVSRVFFVDEEDTVSKTDVIDHTDTISIIQQVKIDNKKWMLRKLHHFECEEFEEFEERKPCSIAVYYYKNKPFLLTLHLEEHHFEASNNKKCDGSFNTTLLSTKLFNCMFLEYMVWHHNGMDKVYLLSNKIR